MEAVSLVERSNIVSLSRRVHYRRFHWVLRDLTSIIAAPWGYIIFIKT